ncbi:carboxymuconolactone decarboxylase family protein [Tistrella mobilis]
MAGPEMVEYEDASPEVRAVYDDIMQTRRVDRLNNFWKVIAVHPPTLKRTWESLKEVMAPGALDPMVKELIFTAVSATNGCAYCVTSHGGAAARAGASPEMIREMLAVVGMANETNRLVFGYQVPMDEPPAMAAETDAADAAKRRPRSAQVRARRAGRDQR